MNKQTMGEKIFAKINILFMLFLIVICVYPIIHVIFASVSDPVALMKNTGILIKPLGFTLKGYQLVFKNPDITSGYLNTIFYVVAGTSVNMVMTCLAAYVLSRRRAYWVNKMMFFVVLTLFLSGGLIPFYLTVKDLGLSNTRWALIIPTAIWTWNLIVMRTSFLSIPESLEQAARIDGAGDIRILLQVVLPLSVPIIAVMILFYGVGQWNSWFYAMVFLRKREMYPLQLILREILIMNSSDSTVMATDVEKQADLDMYRLLIQYCTIVVATVPILLLYPFLQKYFVKGVMVGAIKG